MSEFKVIAEALLRVDPNCVEIIPEQYLGNDRYGKLIYVTLGGNTDLEMEFDQDGTLISYY